MRVSVSGEKELNITLNDFWERSVNGFGSYSQEISKSVYDKHMKNNTIFVTGSSYKTSFETIGESFFVFVKK